MAPNHRSTLLVSTALQATAMLLLSLPAHAQPAPNARPLGGTVVGGAASISNTANNTAINQSTQRAAVNWNSFNVGSQQSVTFNQPNASAVTLNRVTGPDPSQIAGRIDANGQIVLVNQSGVTFYKGAQVNANGLMVTAAGISNQNFMAGAMIFNQPGNPNAKIDNQGSITVKQAGLAALVAPQVANSGVITAQLGHVVLAGAKTATLDLYGDGLLSLDVTNQVTQAPTGTTALVTNTGVITANGGTVQLTARAADGIVQNLVQAGGKISTATIGDRTGTIALNGVGGSIIVEGQLSARGTAPGTAGGDIEVVSSGNVTLASTAKINASGRAGGGVVAIGTTLARAKGGPSVTPTSTAQNVNVQHGASITADAITNGDGGHVAVLSTGATQMNGAITAQGGTQGGNGGFVEVSGNTLGMTGSVDLSAPHGTLGTLLLDPTFLDVIGAEPSGGTEEGNFVDNGGTVLAGDGLTGTPDTISNTIINGTTANVLLQALNTLTVGANINLTIEPGQNLTMEAGGTLTIDPGIVVTASGDVILATGGAGPSTPPPALSSPLIAISGAVTSTGGSVTLLSGTGGTINLGTGGSVSAATITLNSGTGGIALTGNAALGQTGSNIDITSAGPVSQATTSTITASELGSSGGVAGTTSLIGTGNAIDFVTDFPVTGGDLVLVDHSNLVLIGTQSANNLFFEVANAGGSLTLGTATVTAPGTPATLIAGTGGRISLVSDNYVVANAGSSITTNAGTVELAPFSAIAASILDGGGLLVDATLLSIIQTNNGTLDVGGFTNVPAAATTPVASAASVDIGAPLDLTGIATTLRLDATGAITQTGGAVTVSNLTGTGGAWTLDNAANAITTLGNITAASFVLADSTSLTIDGTATSATDATITDSAALTITAGGSLAAATIDLTAGTGGIALTGNAALGQTGSAIDITSAGPVSEASTSTITAQSLDSSGGVAGNVSLLGTSNAIDFAGDFSVTGGGDLTLVDHSNLTLIGTLGASNLFFEVDNKAGTLQLGTGVFGPPIPAILIAGTGGRISLVADNYGAVTDSSITTNAGTVELAPFSTTAAVSILGVSSPLVDGLPLSIIQTNNGTLDVGGYTNVPLGATTPAASAASINIGGTALDLTDIASTLRLDSTGAITQTGGPVTVSNLIGTGGAWTLNNAGNAIATLGDITAASFALADSTNLLINGPLVATNIAISAPASQITLGDGSTIITGGSVRPPGPIQPALEPANGGPGAYLQAASFTQVGLSTLLGSSGGPATLQISVTGNIQFDPPVGLLGPTAWLILDLTTGTAAGNVFVNALDVSYTVPGSASLFGTIAGITGGPAAAAGFIEPAVNISYLFNGCEIGAAACLPAASVPPTLTPPPVPSVSGIPDFDLTSALGGLYPFLPGAPPPLISLPNLVLVALPMLPSPAPQLTDPDVVPPNISYLDY